MKKFLKSFLFQIFFWLILFTVERIFFLLWYGDMLANNSIGASAITGVFLHAFKLDMSTIAYILVVPFFLSVIQLFIRKNWINRTLKIYVALIVIIYILVCAAETGLFREWNTKLSYRALVYLRHPEEVVNSAQTRQFILLVSLWLIQSAVFIYIYNRFFFIQITRNDMPVSWRFRLSWIILMPIILFLTIRGGFQAIPITASQSYFSRHNILNITAVNPGYNIFFSLLGNLDEEAMSPFFTMPDKEARQIVDAIRYVPKDTTIIVTKTSRPNIVIILLESWPGDAIESLGGDSIITPEFHKLEKDGLLFTDFYATGNRSQQGNASIFAGLPGIPITTLADHPEKYHVVPSLIKILDSLGYYTSFYFGGQLIYGNLKSFIIENDFNRVVEGADFDRDLPRGKLGIPDEYVLPKFAADLQKMPQPFFSTVFTLSSHSPYDYPGERPIKSIKVENKFINSVHYTDRCLGAFFKEIKKSPVWDSTLFLLMSDHSHPSYHGYPLTSFEYHKIPLLITGGALKKEYTGQQMNRLFDNSDIPLTILKQLGLSGDSFTWSRDMFNPYAPQYAFFELNDGFGWKRPYGNVVKSVVHHWYYKKDAPVKKLPELEKEGDAYVHVLLKEFLAY